MRLPNLTSSSARRLVAIGVLILDGCLNPRPDEMPSADNAPSPGLLLPDAPANPGAIGEQSGPTAANGNPGSSDEAAPSEGIDAPAIEAPTTPASGDPLPGDAGAPDADAGPDAN